MPIPLIPSSSSYFPDGPAWITSGNAVCRNAFCNNATRTDNATRSDSNTFKYDAMSTNPRIVLYCYWRRLNAGLQLFFSEMLGSISATHPVIYMIGICFKNSTILYEVYLLNK